MNLKVRQSAMHGRISAIAVIAITTPLFFAQPCLAQLTPPGPRDIGGGNSMSGSPEGIIVLSPEICGGFGYKAGTPSLTNEGKSSAKQAAVAWMKSGNRAAQLRFVVMPVDRPSKINAIHGPSKAAKALAVARANTLAKALIADGVPATNVQVWANMVPAGLPISCPALH
jgi:hypothetical protein